MCCDFGFIDVVLLLWVGGLRVLRWLVVLLSLVVFAMLFGLWLFGWLLLRLALGLAGVLFVCCERLLC